MPSSITLTVSHLPRSTSFFLSTLQPLGYGFRCQTGQTIGFGLTSSSTTPPDFWITQELPGVPAGAAHVAFPASSHDEVKTFFKAALKAGGKIHGEPCVRDQTGYYSAAVIDFDGNSIEAVYHPPPSISDDKENNIGNLALQKSTSKSRSPTVNTAALSRSSTQVKRDYRSRSVTPPKNKGDVLDTIFNEAQSVAKTARDFVNQVKPNLDTLTRSNPNNKLSDSNRDQSGDNILGTLVGVAAGAALHFAISGRSDKNSTSQPRRPSVTNRSLTEPPTRSTYHQSDTSSQTIRHNPSNPHRDGKYISSIDDDRSTIRPKPSRSRSYSFDSGFVSSSPTNSDSTYTSPSKHRPKDIETRIMPPPPSSYRGPQSEKNHSKKSSSYSSSSHHSTDTQKTSRRDLNYPNDKMKTVLHIIETKRIKDLPSRSSSTMTTKNRDSRSNTTSSIHRPNNNSTSHHDSYHNGNRNNNIYDPPRQLPRSSTWSSSSTNTNRRSNETKSMIGKKKDVDKLDLPNKELRPCDSVSQVGINTTTANGSSSRNRRRRD